MFGHVTIGVSDLAASHRFYAAVLGALGRAPSGDLAIVQAGEGRAVTSGLHIGFSAPDVATIDAFWRAGIDLGAPDDGAPGTRLAYGPDYVGAFLLDPDGNSVEACLHDNRRAGTVIDHLWVRVRDRAASVRFYEAIGPPAGIRITADHDDRTRFTRGPSQGSISLVADGRPVTTPFHLAFAAPAGAAMDPVLDPDGHTVEVV